MTSEGNVLVLVVVDDGSVGLVYSEGSWSVHCLVNDVPIPSMDQNTIYFNLD